MVLRPILTAIVIPIVVLSSLAGCSDQPFDDDFDRTCSPWCTVADGCTRSDYFSQCMSECARELYYAESVSSQCADSVRNQNVCLSELTCEELDAWREEVPPDSYPCKDADDAVYAVCFP